MSGSVPGAAGVALVALGYAITGVAKVLGVLAGRLDAILYYAALAVVFLLVVWRLGFLRMTPEEKAAADRVLQKKRGA